MFAGLLVCWSAVQVVGWLVGLLFSCLLRWLVSRLTGCLVSWLCLWLLPYLLFLLVS